MINQNKYEDYIKKKLAPKYQVNKIELLKKLPKEIWYLTWSVGDSEVDKSFRVLAKDLNNHEIELFVQVKSILWFIIRAMIWVKKGNEFERIKRKD